MYVCMYVCMYVHVHMKTYVYVYTHAHTHTYIYLCLHTSIPVNDSVYIYICGNLMLSDHITTPKGLVGVCKKMILMSAPLAKTKRG